MSKGELTRRSFEDVLLASKSLHKLGIQTDVLGGYGVHAAERAKGREILGRPLPLLVMVLKHGDSAFYRSVEQVMAKLIEPAQLNRPCKLFCVSERDVMRNVIADESLENGVFKDGQRVFGPDRLNRLVAKAFMFR